MLPVTVTTTAAKLHHIEESIRMKNGCTLSPEVNMTVNHKMKKQSA